MFFFVFFLISILPISDADSVALHQNLSNTIYQNGIKNINLDKNISFTIFSNTQNLMIISPILKSDNFGAQLNLITLIFFTLCCRKENKNFIFILFSMPLIIYFVSTQKLQLFFGLIYLITFIQIKKDHIKSKLELFIITLLLAFYSSGNSSYILFASALFLYFFFREKKQWKNLIIFSLFSFFITLFPIFIIKHLYFHNFFAPFFDNIIGTNRLLLNSYSYSIRSMSGWISDPTNFKLYLMPFFPINISSLSASLGAIFLLMIFNLKLLNKTKYFPLIIIALVISTGQILPRYYFEAFLILAYYFKNINLFSKIIITSSNVIILLISLCFIYVSYFSLNVTRDKTKYMNRFSYTYFNSQQYKKLKLDENILDLSIGRPSAFFENNIYSTRTLAILTNLDSNSEYIKKFINKNSIKYIISNDLESLPKCILVEKIGLIDHKKSVRNIFKNYEITKHDVLEIKSNKCQFNKNDIK